MNFLKITPLLILALTLPLPHAMADAVIFNGANVKALKQNLDLNGQVSILSGTTDPTSSATSAPAGSLYLNTSSAGVYKKNDAGSTTNWTQIAVGADTSYEATGVGLAATVASNALTVALKQKDGSTNCSAGAPCRIGFRSSTSATGGYNQRSVTGALSIVAPSGATLGQASAVAETTYVYSQDNTGTPQLCLSTNGFFDEGSNQTSTAITSGSTTRSTLYCTSAVTGPVRLIGSLLATEATAGTWASAPTVVSLVPLKIASLITGAGNQERIERVAFGGNTAMTASCTSTPCSIGSQSGSWVTSVSRSTAGNYTINIASGTFSATPWCVTSTDWSMANQSCAFRFSSSSTTAAAIYAYSGASSSDGGCEVICMGPR